MRLFINIWLIIGILLVIFGWGPLYLIIFLAQIGVYPDPNPNPIGPGLLYFFTFLPAVICLTIGIVIGIKRKAKPVDGAAQPNSVPALIPAKPATLTPEQLEYVAASCYGGTAGVFYYWYMGVPQAFFAQPANIVWWPRVVAHARQEAWDAGNWVSFDQFKQRSDEIDNFCKYFLLIAGSMLLILFIL